MYLWHRSPLFLAVAALAGGLGAPGHAQESGGTAQADNLVLEEVVVTARRREEALQDVPISMTVFNQDQLDDANIINAGDLATYTPSLQVNNRFGGDTTQFSIRGFSQELRTTASVGVYFAEVIAQRGANTSVSGDGAGPGDLFDLQNVQVLKGPQGTLFGRNTTGGAILLTPRRPTDELEGYVEGSVGDYDMWRGQGVINIPVADSLRLRLGIDHQERDGYLDNISGIGPDHFADVDYTAWRASVVWDITDTLENYTILKGAESDNNGYPGSIFACNEENVIGSLACVPDLEARKAAGNNGFFDVYSFVPNPQSKQEQWQVINTTTWDITDNLLLKNILSYAELETNTRSAIYGTNWVVGGVPFIFQMVGLSNGRATTDQSTLVEELQLQGTSFGERLTWQTGLYYEKSEPENDYGSQSPSFIDCEQYSIQSPNPEDWRCNGASSRGTVQSAPGGVTYKNQAAYFQGTFDFNNQWSTTLGIRYTDDQTDGQVTDNIYRFPAGGLFPPNSVSTQVRKPEVDSDKFTWLAGVDYKPTDDILLYAKYALGYRQGNVNLAGIEGLNTVGPEEVDSYELGAKTSFFGSVPGTFNIAAFYNDFTDQQIQYGYFAPSGVGTTAVVNAGASTIWGIEVETSLELFEGFVLSAGYTYLDTNVDEIVFPELPPGLPVEGFNATTAEDEPLSYSPENELVLTASYDLPVDADMGDMNFSVTYIYVDERQAVSEETSIYATLDDYDLINLNFNWRAIAGGPVDLSLFATNVADEEYITFITGNWNTAGVESGQVGVPRMYGARLRYNF